MNFIGNLLINAICAAILIVIFVANLKNCRGGVFSCKLFQYIIVTGIVMFIVDTLGRLDGSTPEVSVPWLNQVGNFLLYTFNVIIPLLWLAYVIYQVYGDMKIMKKLALPFTIYAVLHTSVIVLNLFYGFYYTIDANNVYTRQFLYVVSILWNVIPLLVALVLTILSHKKIDSRKFSAYIFFPLAPAIGTILSFFTYGYSVVLPSMLISYLLVFIGIQSDTMRVDYLTGAFNRRHLEDNLRRKISEKNSSFGSIMIDIDDYKTINDTYGHLVGDRALIDFAHVLQKSVGVNDIVARYGGDEFMIIIESKNEKGLHEIAEEITTNIRKFNDKNIYPFKLTASMGLSMYHAKDKLTMEQFQNHLDDLMYQDKKHKKAVVTHK
ncbi:MAG: GGDEF domain-containing protein [Methanomicrobia archaeon]|nr:GGDEF domain-containing protein [Methanomicrobia archaeon]